MQPSAASQMQTFELVQIGQRNSSSTNARNVIGSVSKRVLFLLN